MSLPFLHPAIKAVGRTVTMKVMVKGKFGPMTKKHLFADDIVEVTCDQAWHPAALHHKGAFGQFIGFRF